MGKDRLSRTEKLDRLARIVARAIVDRFGNQNAPAGRIYAARIDATKGGLVVHIFTKPNRGEVTDARA